jgi:hypothetical protein
MVVLNLGAAPAALVPSLEVAVPLWVERIRMRGQTIPSDSARERMIRTIAEHGDDILFRSTKTGATAAAFNDLAEALAYLSFCPGGVKAFGLHFESTP